MIRAAPEERALFGDAGILPLVNVAFLLLVFFLAAATLPSPQQATIEPPEAASGEAHDPARPELAIDAEGAMWLAGEPVEEAGLDAALAALAQGDATLLVVRIDRAAEAAHLVHILAIATTAGFPSVELVTVGPAL